MDHHDAHWFKSSHSGGSGTECLEAAHLSLSTAVRDSKALDGPSIDVPHAAWADFVRAIQDEGFASNARIRLPAGQTSTRR
ncbi:DUF397 domain-containing protein [Streptomyces candidus]|uniref:DUF397 domain-containing protein n=1 Tax=Streptomyces candidus TaxID=67283 RepID=A0A7X0HFX6_9ACTN|nr:DUF397 domain-containing protein [Streptomyces candidus]MBB6436937.1 hypothetical protein [Streptomyces candidus]GHH32320.1 hypothetical protein GCM10018773_01200 [Streptomyces candidus]